MAEHREDPEFPKDLLVWGQPRYFYSLEEAGYLVRPLCDVLAFSGTDEQVSILTKDIKNRWDHCEQPLFFLVLALHPGCRECAIQTIAECEKSFGKWLDMLQAYMSAMRLTKAVGFYYENTSLVNGAPQKMKSPKRSSEWRKINLSDKCTDALEVKM